MIGIAVQLVRPPRHNPCRAVVTGPANKEADRGTQVGMALGDPDGLVLGLDVIEVRKKLQVFAKAAGAQACLEPVPQVRLEVIELAQRLEAFLVDQVPDQRIAALRCEGTDGVADPGQRLSCPTCAMPICIARFPSRQSRSSGG